MSVKLIFTEEAEKNLILILNQIENRFGKNVRDRVLKDIEKIIMNAKFHPELGKRYRDDIRYIILRKRSLMFYKNDGKTMLVIAFFDTRENWFELL